MKLEKVSGNLMTLLRAEVLGNPEKVSKYTFSCKFVVPKRFPLVVLRSPFQALQATTENQKEKEINSVDFPLSPHSSSRNSQEDPQTKE